MEIVGGRAVHPVNVRVGGFYRAPDAGRIAAPWPSRCAGPGRRPRHGGVGGRLRVPRRRGRLPLRRAARPTGTLPDRVRPGRLLGRPRRDARRSSTTLVIEEHVERSTALQARLDGRDQYLTGPLARYALERRPRCPTLARRGGRRRRARGRLHATRSAASWCAPSSWCSPATRRCASSTAYEPPDPPAAAVDAAGRRPAPARPRRPGAAVAPLRARRRRRHRARPASCPRPRRTSSPSRPTCAHVVAGRARPRRRGAHVALRAGRAQPRPVHLVRRALPRRHRGAP